jgi:hypothetical protein
MAPESFELRCELKRTIDFLLDSPHKEATLADVAKSLRTTEKLLKMEIASQIGKYPALTYNTDSDSLVLYMDAAPLFIILRDVFDELEESYFVSRRFKGVIYEIGAKSRNINDFWDRIEFFARTSDELSSFWLGHLLTIATSKYGPLGTTFFDNAIGWQTKIVVQLEGHEKPIFNLNCGNLKVNASLVFMRDNPEFFKDRLNPPFLDRNEIRLLESLGIISLKQEQQIYYLKLPIVYPWNLNFPFFKLQIEDDYCRKLQRENDLEICNPLSARDVIDLLLNLVATAKASANEVEDKTQSDFVISEKLREFSNNVESFIYSGGPKSSMFEKRTAFPLSLEDPNKLGEILWALHDVPDVIVCLPFEFRRALIFSAINSTRFLCVQTSDPSLAGDAVAFFTAREVSEKFFAIAESVGMTPTMKFHSSGQIVAFNKLKDMKRLGVVPQESPMENQGGTSARVVLQELLEAVLKKGQGSHMSTIRIDKLADKLEMNIVVLKYVIQRYLARSLDLESFPGYVMPEEDPWLEIEA